MRLIPILWIEQAKRLHNFWTISNKNSHCATDRVDKRRKSRKKQENDAQFHFQSFDMQKMLGNVSPQFL